jgi:hypothetical protein
LKKADGRKEELDSAASAVYTTEVNNAAFSKEHVDPLVLIFATLNL